MYFRFSNQTQTLVDRKFLSSQIKVPQGHTRRVCFTRVRGDCDNSSMVDGYVSASPNRMTPNIPLSSTMNRYIIVQTKISGANITTPIHDELSIGETFSISIPSDLPKGKYYLEIYCDSENGYSKFPVSVV